MLDKISPKCKVNNRVKNGKYAKNDYENCARKCLFKYKNSG